MRIAGQRLIEIPAAAGALALASASAAAWIAGAWDVLAIAVLFLSRLLACALFRLDRLDWRGLAFRDAVTAAAACAGGSAIAFAACATLPSAWPARLLAADLAVYPCLTLGIAMAARHKRLPHCSMRANAARTLIWGAGAEGRTLLDRIRRSRPSLEVFGWLDDDPVLAELDCDGVPVLGPLESLPLLVELHGVQAVLVAIPRLSAERRSIAEDLARWSGARLVFVQALAGSLESLESLPPAHAVSYREKSTRAL